MASKISKGEWKIVFLLTGLIDAVQVVIDFFPPFGEAINAVADIVIGVLIVIYFQIRGVSMLKRPSRLLSLLGVGILEEFTGGLAPAWIIDIWYIKKTVTQDEEISIEATRGTRQPNRRPEPLNAQAGKRPPRLPAKRPPILPTKR